MGQLATKENRLKVQQYEFDALIKKGYSREDYKGLFIFTMTDEKSTWLKVFRGTAANHTVYTRYRTEQQATDEIKRLKDSQDRRIQYKAELKNNPTKSSAANAASAIREELKKHFPNIKFSVKSSNFSMGDSVSISWTDGPTAEQVKKYSDKYQYGHFDGMTDMYESTNRRNDIPQTKYVSENRTISEESQKAVVEQLTPLYKEESEYEIKILANRIIYNSEIPFGAVVVGIKRTGISCGSIQDFYTLDFDLSNVKAEPKQETPNFEAVEVPEGEIQIIDYSEKAIAVIGETKPIKDKLKELGGKFNFRLSCGAGWIFPKTKLEEVQNLFTV